MQEFLASSLIWNSTKELIKTPCGWGFFFKLFFIFTGSEHGRGSRLRAPTLEFQIDHNCPNKGRFLESNTTNSTSKCHSTPKPNKYTVYALISSQQGMAFERSPRLGHLQHYLLKKKKSISKAKVHGKHLSAGPWMLSEATPVRSKTLSKMQEETLDDDRD